MAIFTQKYSSKYTQNIGLRADFSFGYSFFAFVVMTLMEVRILQDSIWYWPWNTGREALATTWCGYYRLFQFWFQREQLEKLLSTTGNFVYFLHFVLSQSYRLPVLDCPFSLLLMKYTFYICVNVSASASGLSVIQWVVQCLDSQYYFTPAEHWTVLNLLTWSFINEKESLWLCLVWSVNACGK